MDLIADVALGVSRDSRAWRTQCSPPGRGKIRTVFPAAGTGEGKYLDSQGDASGNGFRLCMLPGPW